VYFQAFGSHQLKGDNIGMKGRFSCTLTDQNKDDKGVQDCSPFQENAHNKLRLLLGMLQTYIFSSR